MTFIILPRSGRGLFPGRRLPPGEKIILLCVLCASSEQRERAVKLPNMHSQICHLCLNKYELISITIGMKGVE